MNLTKQQKRITELLLQGLPLQNVADTLFVSKSTIRTHINTIFKKFDVHTIGQYCGLYVKDLQDEIDVLKQQVEYYKRYKKMWDELKKREFQERRG